MTARCVLPDVDTLYAASLRHRRRHYPTYDGPPAPHEIGICPVCELAVFDDPAHDRNDWTSPVRMTVDGDYDGWTHAGCEDDYWRAVKTLEEAHRYRLTIADLLDAESDRAARVTSLGDRERDERFAAGPADRQLLRDHR